MSTLALILIIVAGCCMLMALASLVTPRAALFLKTKTRMRGFGVWLLISLVLFAVGGACIPKEELQEAQKRAAEARAAAQARSAEEEKAKAAAAAIEAEKNKATEAEKAKTAAKEAVEKRIREIKKVDSKITDVRVSHTDEGDVWSVFVTQGTIVSDIIYETGMFLQRISEELVDEKLVQPSDEFLYFVHVPTEDQYGRSGVGLAMKIAWKGEDLLKINWKNMFPPKFLNLASRVELRHMVRNDIAKLAGNPKEAAQYKEFLVKVLQ